MRGCRFFPFSTLNISGLKSFAEKSTEGFMEFLLYVTRCFPLIACKSLSLFLTFSILIIICLGVDLFGFNLCGTLCASWT